jgi:hypothetical protein
MKKNTTCSIATDAVMPKPIDKTIIASSAINSTRSADCKNAATRKLLASELLRVLVHRSHPALGRDTFLTPRREAQWPPDTSAAESDLRL